MAQGRSEAILDETRQLVRELRELSVAMKAVADRVDNRRILAITAVEIGRAHV